MKTVLFVILFSTMLQGCSSGESFERVVYEADKPGEWPFRSEAVTIGCDAIGYPYVIDDEGVYYGLTGHAQQKYGGIDELYIKGKNLSLFIEKALSKCPK